MCTEIFNRFQGAGIAIAQFFNHRIDHPVVQFLVFLHWYGWIMRRRGFRLLRHPILKRTSVTALTNSLLSMKL